MAAKKTRVRAATQKVFRIIFSQKAVVHLHTPSRLVYLLWVFWVYDSFSSFICVRWTHTKRVFEVSVSRKIFRFSFSVDDVAAVAVANSKSSTHKFFDFIHIRLAFSAKDPGNIVCVVMLFPFSVSLYYENILIRKFFSRRLKMLTSTRSMQSVVRRKWKFLSSLDYLLSIVVENMYSSFFRVFENVRQDTFGLNCEVRIFHQMKKKNIRKNRINRFYCRVLHIDFHWIPEIPNRFLQLAALQRKIIRLYV